MLRKPAVLIALGILWAVGTGTPSLAGPPASTGSAPAANTPAASPRVIPDYGGRSSDIGSALDGSGAAPPLNPLAQAGRAFEALVIVLVIVVGGLYLLKRSGWVKGDGAGAQAVGGPPWSFLMPRRPSPSTKSAGGEATTELLSVLGSQLLPQSGGAQLHLVSVGGRLLLLGATAQSVTLLTEVGQIADLPEGVAPAETPEEAAAFAAYLEKAGVEPPSVPAGKATEAKLAAAAGRLKSLVRPSDTP